MLQNHNNNLGLGYPFNVRHFLSNLNRYYKAGFWFWDSNTNRIHFGKKFVNALGFKESDNDNIPLDEFFKLVHRDDKKSLEKSFQRLRHNSALHQEMDFRLKIREEWQHKRIFAFAVKDNPDASSYYIIGQFRNVDPVKSDTNTHDESITFERFANLLHKHQLALLEIDLDGTVVNWNKSTTRLFQFDSSNTQSVSLREGFADDTWKKFQEWLLSGSGKPFTSIYRNISGNEFNLSWSKLADIPQDKKRFIVAARDISQLVEFQNQIKRHDFQNEVISSFFSQIKGQTTPDEIFLLLGQTIEKAFPKSISIVFSYSADDSFVTLESIFGVKTKAWDTFIDELGWNPVGRRLFIEKEKLATLISANVEENIIPFNELLDGIVSATTFKVFERTFKIGKSYISGIVKDDKLFGGIILFQTPDSEPIDSQFLNRISIVASTVIDMSKANLDSCQMVDGLKKQLAEKYELLTYINHSIRTPLNSIIGFSSMLDFTELDKSLQTEYLRIIQNQSKSLLDLTNELQDFVRISTGALTVIKTKQNVNDFFHELKANIDFRLGLLELYNIKVNYTIPENTDFLELYIDSGRLNQALSIYFIQFIKFIQTGSLNIGYSIEDDKIKIFIHEGDSSIDSKIRTLFTDDLKALLNGTYSHSSHFNILLANRLLTLLEGEVEILNDGKLKLEVKFGLIANEAQPQADELSEEQAIKRVEFKNSVVLIVEDEEINYLILNELLTAWGVSTIWAKNGREAVDLVSSLNQGINLILMDIRMPVMDGYAATMEIKQVNSAIPVVAQTAFSAPQERLKAQAAGCNGYITKPIDPNILHHVLEMYLA
ncbi:MAG TPA: response regulator [Tenuifilum sp.]|mgnify:FL=1|nr:response regulator [Tenuifilum sp.]